MNTFALASIATLATAVQLQAPENDAFFADIA